MHLKKLCMSVIYACQKDMNIKNICILEIYMHGRNICLSEIYQMDVGKLFMYFKKHMHVRNIIIHFSNICMYFQKHKTTKSDLQIFLVCVVWKYPVKIS